MLFYFSCVQSSPAAEVSTGFTVRDAIGAQVVIAHGPSPALLSPDGHYVAIHTRRGDIDTDQLVDCVLLWRTADLAAFATQRTLATAPPSPQRYTRRASRPDGVISQLRWISNDSLVFLAEDPENTIQAFALEVRRFNRARKLTNSETDVVGFERFRGRTVYFAIEPPRHATSVVATGEPFSWLVNTNQPRWWSAALWTADEAGRNRRQLGPYTALRSDYRRAWPSPNGQYVVTLTPAVNAPPYWSAYSTALPELNYALNPTADPSSLALMARPQFSLIDLTSGQTRPLLDAPVNSAGLEQLPTEAFWTSDSSTVILSNTLLPVSHAGTSPHEVEHQTTITIVDIRSHQARRLYGLDLHTLTELRDIAPSSRRGRFELEWQPARNSLRLREWRGDALALEEEILTEASPSLVPDVQAPHEATVTVVLRQTQNAPPTLWVNVENYPPFLLLDLNPNWAQRTFGHAETVTWTVSSGRRVTGALIYPTGYEPGQRYPLVVQTHGFDPNEFLTDGPFGATSAFAAQPLANAGFVVLQVPEQQAITVDRQEATNVAHIYIAGVRHLVELGVADENHVGIIGWSRTGFHVLAALTQSPQTFKAALISDAVQFTYSQALWLANAPNAASEFERINGSALPHSNSFDEWAQGSPLYAAIDTPNLPPIRIESIADVTLMWETFARLHAAGHPIEHILYPNGAHVLALPSERLESQGGMVDWFSFWLREGPVSDATRLQRWTALREQQGFVPTE